jgi:hypothetical protein
MAQAVECLLCKHEALSSNNSATKKKQKESKPVLSRIPYLYFSSVCSEDQEAIQAQKIWKKAIMLVWRAAANHR